MPISLRLRMLLAASGIILLLHGCAGPPEKPEPPATGYVPGADYHVLMAEIARQTDAHLTAAQEYLSAAEATNDSAAARRATDYAFDYGLDRFALRSAERWLDLEPESTGAREYLGRLYLRRYDLERAVEHYSALLGPVDGRSGDDYLGLEADLAGEENAMGVLRLIQRLAAGQPRDESLQLAIARAAFRADVLPLALRYARAVAATGDSYEAEVLVGRVLFAQDDADGALAYIEELARTRPVIALELEYVRLLAASRREALAQELVARMLDSYGREPELLSLRASIAISDGNYAQAELDLKEMAAMGRNVYESLYYLGQIEEAREDWAAAIEKYSRIGAGPFLLPAQQRIAVAHLQSGDPDAGLLHLSNFETSFPRYGYEMVLARIALLQNQQRTESAVAEYDALFAYRPPTPEQLMNRGIALDRLGRSDEAIASMRQAWALDSTDPDVANAYGYTLAIHDRRPRLAAWLVRYAVNLKRDNPAILDSMGWVLFQQGKKEAALSWLEPAYAKLRDPEIAAHLGEVLWSLGQKDSARRIWQEAMIVYPDSEPLLETMARFGE